MAIYVTGDTHGDFRRFRADIFPEQRGLTKDDFVIVCGDFGIWDDSPEERYWLDWLNDKPFTTLFVTGNHSNYELLARLPVQAWQGGQVQFVRPSVVHLMRGQVYSLFGYRFFTMGGARSHDIQGGILQPDDPLLSRKIRRLRLRGLPYRIEHKSWWKQELPSQAEYQTARQNLAAVQHTVDFVITHCAPTSVQQKLDAFGYVPDALTDFLDEVAQTCSFRKWFFGHYHQNRMIDSQFIVLYEQIIRLLG